MTCNDSTDDVNVVQTLALYTEAAEEGVWSAKCDLGISFRNGTGVKKDVRRAAALFTEAADEGDTIEKFHLAFCRMNEWNWSGAGHAEGRRIVYGSG